MINPWDSQTIKLERMFKEFGLKPFPKKFSDELNHYLFERNIVVAHRDFDKVMKRIRERKPFINMTGIATSGKMHLGHKVIVDLFKLFASFGAHNYFCIADIDAYTSRERIKTLNEAREYAIENLTHVLALGLKKSDIYVQSNYKVRYYAFAFEVSKKITRNAFEATYGHIDLGKIAASFLQYADILHAQLEEFSGPMPSVTPIGLDQDPHARITRDIAKRLPYKFEMPSFIYIQQQSGLLENTKMSSSLPESAIFLSDSKEEIRKKISNAFTGGRETASLQRKLGGIPEKCKVLELLRFHYPDTKEIEKIAEECRKGCRLCGETKSFAIDFFTKMLSKHQKKAKKMEKKAKRIIFG